MRSAPFDVTVVVPTYREAENVGELVRRLEEVLAGRQWELIIVDDDSPDGTADRVRRIAEAMPHVRVLLRIGRRGLSRAVVEGALAANAAVIAVMDADLQHDESALPEMLDRLAGSDLDLVVGSRYSAGGGTSDWSTERVRMSRLATRLSGWVLRQPLSDPMSGFFVIRRSTFLETVRRLSGEGYKILLDIVASAPRQLRIAEVGYRFRPRHAGESKLDAAVVWEYVLLLLDKRIGRLVPPRLVLFALVGGSGVVVHFATLATLLKGFGAPFVPSQATATAVAMTSNFLLNNLLTYRDRRLRGWAALKGLASFYAVCGLGALANVGIAGAVFEREQTWWLAGAAGVLVGTLWNYLATASFTWGRQR